MPQLRLERFLVFVAWVGGALAPPALGQSGSACELAKLLSPRPTPGQGFGRAVATDGERVYVASWDERVRVFVRSGAQWLFEVELSQPDPNPNFDFGRALAVHKGLLAATVGYKRTVAMFRLESTGWHYLGEVVP